MQRQAMTTDIIARRHLLLAWSLQLKHLNCTAADRNQEAMLCQRQDFSRLTLFPGSRHPSAPDFEGLSI